MSENITTYLRYKNNNINFGYDIVDFFGGDHTRAPAQYTPNDIFGIAVYKIIREECGHLYDLSYTPWIQEQHPDNDPDYENWETDIKYFRAYILRQLKLKYKYFDYFKNKWSMQASALGDMLTETIERDSDRDTTISKANNKTNTHTSQTASTYDIDSEVTVDGESASQSVDENSPLGTSAAAAITTPAYKADGSQTVDSTTTTDRTDTNNISVNSTDTDAGTESKTVGDDLDETITKTREFNNAVEILKELRYQEYGIVDLITDIVDRTCKEFNEFI